MALTVFYDSFKEGTVGGGAITFDSDTIKLALVTSSYTPSTTTHEFFDDITGEVTGANYTAGGATLTSVTVTVNAGVVTVDADNVTWTKPGSGGFSDARYAILYKSTGSAATSPLVGYLDLGADVGNVAGDLILNWNASGIFAVSSS